MAPSSGRELNRRRMRSKGVTVQRGATIAGAMASGHELIAIEPPHLSTLIPKLTVSVIKRHATHWSTLRVIYI